MESRSLHDPVRWGILGTAGITRALLRGARRTRAVDVVAVGSRNADRAAEYANENGIGRAHGSYEALLADPEVEAVYISLPNSLHHPWTIRALEAGKHVLCEKPYTRRHADVAAAFNLAERSRLVLCEAFMWRHHPQARTISELLPEIGELQTIRATFSFELDRPDDIRLRADLDGGSLMDVGTYCVSGARLLTGEEPELVFGTQALGPSGVDVRFNGLLRFPGGAVAEIMSGFETDHRGLEAIGRRRLDPAHEPVAARRSGPGPHPRRGRDADPVLGPIPAGARGHERRDPRPSATTPGTGGRARPGTRHRGALPVGRHGSSGPALRAKRGAFPAARSAADR